MKHLAAYVLLVLGGNSSPGASDIKEVLGSVGVEADDDRLEQLIASLKGKDVFELMEKGKSSLASVPTGGGGGGGASSGGSGGGAAAVDEPEEEEEEEEEQEEDMGGLFGDDEEGY
eukprot:CAMPEP_0174250270 /NCGR_PEP_ID=MMETSP0439-20130205/493_1 /TAXON_ID=0 /ORGANISM="Stereomyxa ramosa, Strain Chinc5" /LENGTH=115 /DNA_ID=CAMNT_0015330289 /DNA_START=109 /DNA_END=456 /DNA_ORIENTATION=-